MKHKWYGDDRDLVKWWTLIHLSKTYGLETIIQVGFLTEDPPRAELETGNDTAPISNEVWSHFRDISNIRNLAKRTNMEILVITKPFSHPSRDEYIRHVLSVIKRHQGNKKIVFLDPDTGIEPTRATEAHVKQDEIRTLWNNLKPNDWMVFYQHARRDRNWIETTRAKFAEACGVTDTKTFRSPGIASNVALYAVEKD